VTRHRHFKGIDRARLPDEGHDRHAAQAVDGQTMVLEVLNKRGRRCENDLKLLLPPAIPRRPSSGRG
jgi:hypothetical protein